MVESKTKFISNHLEEENRKLTNPFPDEIFPKIVQDYIIENVEALGFNKDHLCSAVLSAFSTAFGNMYHLVVKEGFIAKPLLWIIVVGRAGDGKSHVMNLPYQPIRNQENIYRKKFNAELIEFENNPEGKKKPICSEILMNDVTLEGLIAQHKLNERGLCIYSDETISWINSFSRYSSSSQESNYLTMFNGKSLKVARAGNGTFYVPENCINHISGIQKSRVHEMYAGDRGKSGFLDRFLFCFPEKIQLNPINDNMSDPIINRNYETLFQRIFDEYDEDLFKQITYSRDAFNAMMEFDAQILNKHKDNGEVYTSMVQKLRTYFHRIALLIELIDCYSSDKKVREVSIASVQKSIKAIEYFEVNSVKVREMSNDPRTSATSLELSLYNNLPKKFNTKEAKALKDKLKTSIPTISRALRNDKLFEKIDHGIYKKIAV